MNMIRHNDVPFQPATFSPRAMRLSAARAIPNSPESPSDLSCRRLRIQLSVHGADRGHPNESDVCDQFLPYFGGTTAVSTLNLGRDSARPSNGFRHSGSHILDHVIAELRAFDLDRSVDYPRQSVAGEFA